MAFVYETIPEKDWDLFNSWKLRNTNPSHELMVLGKGDSTEDCCYHDKLWWLADRERGIYYTMLGGEDRGLIEVYALIWKGEKIIIRYTEANNYRSKHDDEQECLWYDVFSVVATKGLQDKATVDEIKDIIVETIKADAYRFWSLDTKFVFRKLATPYFISEDELCN